MDGATRSRLLGLLALSRRGEPGERESAARLMDKMLDKYGLTVSDLDGLSEISAEFRFRGAIEERLLTNVIAVVLDKYEFMSTKTIGSSTRMSVIMTPGEKAECDYLYDHYGKLMEVEVEVWFSAFVIKNKLFPLSEVPEHLRNRELSDEDIRRAIRARAMSRQVVRSNPRKAIGGGK